MPKRCTGCGQSPSGLIPRDHDFCEHCGAPLETEPQEHVKSACYRCGKKFGAPKGTTICGDCQQLPKGPPAKVPPAPQNEFAMAAFWGAILPLLMRIAYAALAGDAHISREAQAIGGAIVFFGVLALLAVLGVIAFAMGYRSKDPSSEEQAITFVSLALTTAFLWQCT